MGGWGGVGLCLCLCLLPLCEITVNTEISRDLTVIGQMGNLISLSAVCVGVCACVCVCECVCGGGGGVVNNIFFCKTSSYHCEVLGQR